MIEVRYCIVSRPNARSWLHAAAGVIRNRNSDGGLHPACIFIQPFVLIITGQNTINGIPFHVSYVRGGEVGIADDFHEVSETRLRFLYPSVPIPVTKAERTAIWIWEKCWRARGHGRLRGDVG